MKQTNKPYEGLFITIEGGEGAGKSTLSNSLAKELEKKGYCVLKTREPGGSPLSEHIREILLSPERKYKIGDRAELLLFLAARVQHLEEQILPALYQKKVVICERFNDSTIAYQGCARQLGMHYVEELCKLALEEVSEPDATILLDMDPALGKKRVHELRGEGEDRLEQEDLPFHREVRQGFLHLADQYRERIAIVDASLSTEEILQLALLAIEPHLLLRPCKK